MKNNDSLWYILLGLFVGISLWFIAGEDLRGKTTIGTLFNIVFDSVKSAKNDYYDSLPTIDGAECVQRKGRIVNTLGYRYKGEDIKYPREDVIGIVEGTQCPCVCYVGTDVE